MAPRIAKHKRSSRFQKFKNSANSYVGDSWRYMCSNQPLVAVVKREPTNPQSAWMMKITAF